MPGYEDYAKANTHQERQNLRDVQKNKGLGFDNPEFDYDAEQLKEHLENKFIDNDAAFAKRTKYYFTDYKTGHAKEERYRKIHAQENNKDAENYYRKYGYRFAFKRKYHAMKADLSFTHMRNAMYDYRDDDKNVTDVLKRYEHREEIMKYRMEGMEAAAKAKARNAKHGNYLVARGKLSCNMALKDQLEHFLLTPNLSVRQKNKLNSKLASVKAEIKSAAKAVAKNVQKSHEKWRELNNYNTRYYRNKKQEYITGGYANCREKTAELMADLSNFHDQQHGIEWPKKTVLRNMTGNAVISKAEQKNAEWNTKYQNADIDTELKMKREAFKRFLDMPVPKFSSLKGKGYQDYIRDNLRNYYELTKRACPYYADLLGKEEFNNDPIAKEIRDKTNLYNRCQAKIAYIQDMDNYISFRLKNDHKIEFNKDGYAFNLDQHQHDLQNEENEMYSRLEMSYTNYKSAFPDNVEVDNTLPALHHEHIKNVQQKNKPENIELNENLQDGNILLNDEKIDEDQENVAENIENNIEKLLDKDRKTLIIKENKKKDDKKEENQKEDNQKEENQKEEIQKEENQKEEDKNKEENQKDVAIDQREEEKQEEQNNINIEKEEEKEENLNKIIEKEEEKQEKQEDNNKGFESIVQKELEKCKEKNYFITEKAQGTTLRDFDDADFTDEDVVDMKDEYSADYKLLSNDEANELARKNPANNKDSAEYKKIYGGHMRYDKIDKKLVKVNNDDAIAPYILSPNGMSINEYLRAKDKNDDDQMDYVFTSNRENVHESISSKNDIQLWKNALDDTIGELDKATKQNELPENTRLFRFVSLDFLNYALKLNEEEKQKDNKEVDQQDNIISFDDDIQNMSLDDIVDLGNNLEFGKKYTVKGSADELVNSINKKAGTVVTDVGFMSTGYKLDRGFLHNPICLTILADKGTKCFVTSNEDESEIVLPKNSKYMIIGAKAHGNDGQLMPVSAIKEAYNNKTRDGKPSAKFRGLEIIVKLIKDDDQK